MQRFGGVAQPLAVVDFAHTPDALEKTLRALAPIARQRGGRLISVFGCGGDRDPGKRPQMGALAAALSDKVWVTSDNPRSELPASIIQAVMAGAGKQAISVENRADAIKQAIKTAKKDDVVVIAGKGHEDYQEVAGVKYPFSDMQVAQEALQEMAA
jgi:UDP-N-acetylmuramoyl-L-alanyl-D-glutamate--2,6-diaminopimelate ligase